MDVKKPPVKKLAQAFFILFFLLPILYLLIRSVGGIWAFPALLPQTWNFRGLNYLFANIRPILKSLTSSVLYSLATVLLTLLFSIAPARVLARREFPGKIIMESLLLAPILVPAIVFSLGMYPLLLRIGLTDNVAGVILILSLPAFPYMLRALTAGFESYGPGLETTAWMLGAGMCRRVLTVHLPQLFPAIMAGGMVVFLTAFTEYFLVFLIGGGVVPSFSGYLLPLLRAADWGISSVLSLIFLLLPVVSYIILDRLMTLYYTSRNIKIGGLM